MRYSTYNYLVEDNGNLLIYNTLSNRIVKIYSTDGTTLKKRISAENELSNEAQNVLYNNGMLTDLTKRQEQSLCDSLFFSRVYNGVLSLTLITTVSCNFRCQYCPQEHKNRVMSNEIYNRILKHIIKNINTFNTLKIILFGGEPTLAYDHYLKYLLEIQKICSFYKKQFEGVMISNGYLLNDSMIRSLYKLNILQYQITLDGSAEKHDKSRCLAGGMGTFDVVYKNLLNVLNAVDLKRLSVAIRINTTKELLLDIDNWAKLYIPFSRDKRFLINLGVVQDRGGDYINNFDQELILETDTIYKKAKDKLSIHTFYEDKISPNYFVCKDISKNSFTIDYDGSVRACSKLYTDNIIGHINKNGRIILENKHKTFGLKTNPKCIGCVFEPLCHGKGCGLIEICDIENISIIVRDYILKAGSKSDIETIRRN